MLELVPSNLKIDFLAKAKIAYLISALLLAMSAYMWISRGDEKFGTDYRGGTEMVVKFTGQVSGNDIQAALQKDSINDALVQSFEFGSGEYLIRVGDSGSAAQRIQGALTAGFPGAHEILKTDVVGPTIGAELRSKAMWALSIALVVILIYVSVRFEFAFAVGAVTALFHDVIVAMGVYLLAGHTINAGTIAAALTIIGYSVNDTIVIFDRVREELFKQQNDKLSLPEIVNLSVNATLGRTIITSLLTLMSAVALLVFGGGALADLSLFLVAGIIVGSYSTIYIASPIAIAVENMRAARVAKRVGATS